MTGFVDIHAHVLPGIDDGPATIDDSIAMARAAAEAGTAVLAATPHLHPGFPDVHVEELGWRCDALREALAGAQIPIRLVSGAEVSLVWAVEASDEDLRRATYDQRGTDLLVETPSGSVFGLETFLYKLRAKGIRVTLGHPERSPDFQRNPTPLLDLVHQGVLLQVNAESLIDAGRRSRVRRLAEHLCREGIAHALASDGHRASAWREVTKLAAGVDALSEMVGRERALWMAIDVPGAIVDGADLYDGPPVRLRRGKSRLGRGVMSVFER